MLDAAYLLACLTVIDQPLDNCSTKEVLNMTWLNFSVFEFVRIKSVGGNELEVVMGTRPPPFKLSVRIASSYVTLQPSHDNTL